MLLYDTPPPEELSFQVDVSLMPVKERRKRIREPESKGTLPRDTTETKETPQGTLRTKERRLTGGTRGRESSEGI